MSYILCITVKQSYNWDGNYEDVDAVDLDGEYADFDEAVGVANAICANHRHDNAVTTWSLLDALEMIRNSCDFGGDEICIRITGADLRCLKEAT